MRRRLTVQEQLLIGLGALVVLLLLVYAMISGLTGGRFGDAKTSLLKAKREYRDAVKLREDYERWGREIEERKNRIAQQDPGFDLPSFIAGVERDLKPAFNHKSVTSPTRRPLAGGKYSRTRLTYIYDSKSIGDIVRYLYEIENPKHGIIITSIKLRTRDETVGDSFTMTITLSVVTTEEPVGGS
jgi:hypothetical protein